MQIFATIEPAPHITSTEQEKLLYPKNVEVSTLYYEGNSLKSIKLTNGALFLVNNNCRVTLEFVK